MGKKKISQFPSDTPTSGDKFLIEKADGTYKNVDFDDLGGGGSQDLQSVLDNGDTATNIADSSSLQINSNNLIFNDPNGTELLNLNNNSAIGLNSLMIGGNGNVSGIDLIGSSYSNLQSGTQNLTVNGSSSRIDALGTLYYNGIEVAKVNVINSTSLTAVLDINYINTANATYTDPTPTQGKGFTVYVLNGTATVGGTGYSTVGTFIRRYYHSGAWVTKVYYDKSYLDTIYQATGLALLKSNNLSDLANVQTAKANLNIDKRTTVGDANYTILTTDKEIVTSAALTANRTYTLPTGETAGQEFIVADEFQAIGTYNITVGVASGKKLNGVTNGTVTMVNAGGHRRFFGDGNGNYTYDAGMARITDLRYSLAFNSAVFNPADATTYYIGGFYTVAPSTTAATRQLIVPKSGTITEFGLFSAVTVSASSGSITINIRVNNTTDYLVTSSYDMSSSLKLTVSGLSIPVTANDLIEIKMLTPTWATNPTNVYYNGHILIK